MMTFAIPTIHAIFIHSISLARAFSFGFGHTRGIFLLLLPQCDIDCSVYIRVYLVPTARTVKVRA